MTPPVRPPAEGTTPTLAQAFEAFLGERRYAYAAPDMDRILRRFQDLLAGPEGEAWPLTEIHRLDELVLASQGDKARAAQVVLDFYDYAASRYGLDARSALEGVHFVDDPTERQIEILKYLHQPRGTQEICERFGLEPRTIRKDLRQLAEGTRFLGVDLSADFSGRDHRYRSSQHPVFLVFSLSEA